MPVKPCQEDGKPGFKYGDAGKCYTYTAGDEVSMTKAKQKAQKQGAAIEAAGGHAADVSTLATRKLMFEIDPGRAIPDNEPIPVIVSSDAPVEMRENGRMFIEVLVHSPDAVDLSQTPLPIIATHEMNQVNVGIVDDLKIDGGLLRGRAFFGKRTEAREYEMDVRGRIIRAVSVGYRRVKAVQRADGVVVTSKWVPKHVAMVATGADEAAGFFRSEAKETLEAERENVSQPAVSATTEKESIMDPTQTAAAAVPAQEGARVQGNGPNGESNYDPVADQAKRASAIRQMALGMDINDERAIQHWIMSGKDWNEIGDSMIKVKAERSKQATLLAGTVGLTPSEAGRFSIVRAINAVVNKDWTKAGFEAEASRAAAQKVGRYINEHTFMIPAEVQNLVAMRVLQVGTAAMGGDLVGTDVVSFIDILRNRAVAFQAGVTIMGGLVGQVAIPKKTTAGSFAWLAETGTATASELVLSQVTMTPKRLAGYQEYSKQLMLQSTPDVETLVRNDLASGLAVAVDAGILKGTGANNPLGIRFTTGLGTANPGTGSAVAYADLIAFQTDVASANAMAAGFTYVTTPTVAAIFMGKPRFTNSDTPCWEGGILDGRVVGMRAMSTVQMAAGEMLAGDFSQTIFGQWAGMEVEVNPYANFQADIVGVKATIYADVAVRYPGAYSIGTGMTA